MKLALPLTTIGVGKVLEAVPSISVLQLRGIYAETISSLHRETILHRGPLMGSNKLLNIEWPQNPKWFPKLFSFSTGPACKKVRIKDFYYEARSPILSRDELKAEMKRKIDIIKEKFPNKIAIENTNYYPFSAYDHVTDPEFLTEIVEENDIYFTLDIAHAIVTAMNDIRVRGDVWDYIRRLPLDRCIEIHLSNFGKVDGVYRDLHEAPNNFIFMILEKVLKRVKEDVYVVVEYTRCYTTLVEVYKELEKRFYVINESIIKDAKKRRANG